MDLEEVAECGQAAIGAASEINRAMVGIACIRQIADRIAREI
jgi:hypothetical protein